MRPLSIPTPQSHENYTDYTNEKGGGYLNNKMSAVDMEIWAVLPPHPLCHDLDLFPCLCKNTKLRRVIQCKSSYASYTPPGSWENVDFTAIKL
jgi:hypothetical protein